MYVDKNFKKLIYLGEDSDRLAEEIRNISQYANFIYKKEQDLSSTFYDAYKAMALTAERFERKYSDILQNGIPYFDDGIAGFANEREHFREKVERGGDFLLELDTPEISIFFKTFFLLGKTTLDKLMPFYSYRFYDQINQFSNKGSRLIKAVKKNHRIENKKDFVSLIENAKEKWIDEFIRLRDKYAHYTNLEEYNSFSINISSFFKKDIKSANDFNPPRIKIDNEYINASEYIFFIKREIQEFSREFIKLCDFNQQRRPKCYLQCSCGYEFAKKVKQPDGDYKLKTVGDVPLRVISNIEGYGVLVCPKCGEDTDTDLDVWRESGYTI